MQRLGFPLISLIVFGGVALGLSVLASAGNLPEQKILSPASLLPSAATHETRASLQEMIHFPNVNRVTPRIETVSWSPPTRSSFMATWSSVNGAKGYLLDVSTSNSFNSYVDRYHDLDVGNVNGQAVTGLNPGTTYYYRVRPHTAAGLGGYSNVTTATTEAPTGPIIHPTFDSSISPAIQAMIMRAIGIYESLFSDPITIEILFRYSDTAPNGDPLPAGVLSQSFFVPYDIPWNTFISALRADATTSNDNTANASLPGNALSTNIVPSSANGRAVGLNTPPAMFPDGTLGPGGPYDGIVTLNSAQFFSFTRPLFAGSFDAQRSVEHEIDEVMGLGSYLNTPNAPTPCTSYEAESSGNTIAGGAVIESCPACSGGEKVGFVGNNSGTLQFNSVFADASGRLNVTIWYTNGDAVRYALLSVNGSGGTPLSFPSTGSFQTVGSIQTTITGLKPGSNNTLKFYNPIVGNWAPDFDRIEVKCKIPPPAALRPQDLFSWSSPGVRNLTLDGTRYFSINSGSTNIVNFNQSPPGDFGDWLSESCPQSHPFVQNAFVCPDQFSDISATSPEGINLDVIGYDLVTAPRPAVTTNSPTNVTSSSATLNGTVNPNGLTTSVYFEYGPTTSYGFSTASHNYNGNTTQNVSANLTGLSPNTTYHFRIVATNSGRTSFGADVIFSTLTATGPPVVLTSPATLIGSFSATLNGSLDPHGLTTTVYFQYGTTTNYGSTTSIQTQTGNTYRNITANISGLMVNTTYHFRIVATNSAGTTRGADMTFTTLSPTGSPVVTTDPATFIASFSTTLNGTVDPHGLSTNVYFQYGTTSSYGSTTISQGKTGNTYQSVSANVIGLSANTTYHFRIVASNSSGTVYGSDRTFTTLTATGAPVVMTSPATNISSSSATLNGLLDPHGLATSGYFQYGTTTSYGSNTPMQSQAGNANSYRNIAANINGLVTHTTYHFRIVASNSAGTSNGSDRTFTTP